MKEFIKNVGATVVGIFVFTILVGAIGMMSLVGMVASGSSAKDVADNTVFVINLEGQLQERSVDNPFSQYLGGAASTIKRQDKRHLHRGGSLCSGFLCFAAGCA